MNKEEATFTTKAKAWIKATLPTSLWEVKHTHGKTIFNMNKLEEHQKNWLLAATKKTGCSYKMPDTGYGYNPCDGFNFKESQAFVIICYPTWVVAIHIQDILILNTKSLDEETAVQIAAYKILTSKV